MDIFFRYVFYVWVYLSAFASILSSTGTIYAIFFIFPSYFRRKGHLWKTWAWRYARTKMELNRNAEPQKATIYRYDYLSHGNFYISISQICIVIMERRTKAMLLLSNILFHNYVSLSVSQFQWRNGSASVNRFNNNKFQALLFCLVFYIRCFMATLTEFSGFSFFSSEFV